MKSNKLNNYKVVLNVKGVGLPLNLRPIPQTLNIFHALLTFCVFRRCNNICF